jgi:hypothetical protein
MTVIKLPKKPLKAFNPKRPASALLLAQIEHLEHAVGRVATHVKRTEGQAAKYIADLTAELLRQAQEPTAPAPPPLAGAAPAAASSAPATPVGTKKTATKHHASPAGKAPARKAATRAAPKRGTKTRRPTTRRRGR